jgi:hypothetical protein
LDDGRPVLGLCFVRLQKGKMDAYDFKKITGISLDKNIELFNQLIFDNLFSFYAVTVTNGLHKWALTKSKVTTILYAVSMSRKHVCLNHITCIVVVPRFRKLDL